MEAANAETLWKTNSGADTLSQKATTWSSTLTGSPSPPSRSLTSPSSAPESATLVLSPRPLLVRFLVRGNSRWMVVGVARMEMGWSGEGGVGDATARGECMRVEMEGHDVLIRNLLQLPPTTAPRGAMMASVPTVTPTALAVRFTSRTGYTKQY